MSKEKVSLEVETSASQAPPPEYDSGNLSAQTNYGFKMSNAVSDTQQNFWNETATQPQNTGYPPQNYRYNDSQQNIVVTQVQPGYGVHQAAPPDYTTQAWLVCLCCFWPTGLVAIMKASESKDAAARGDMTRAHALASSARTLIRLSLVVGIISVVFAAVFLGVFFGVVLKKIEEDVHDLNNDWDWNN